MHKPLNPMSYRAHLGIRFVEDPAAAGGDPPSGAGAPAGGTGEPAKPAEKTFTQAEVTAIATREKNEGKAAAERSVAEQLGVSLDEAKAILAAHKEQQDAKKSEAEKETEAARKAREAAESEATTAKQEVHTARLERAFLREGVDLDELGDKAKRLLGLVTVQPGASFEDVHADVKQIKADFPGLFGETEQGGTKRRAPGGDPKGTPPAPKPGEDKFAAGQARAKEAAKRLTPQAGGLLSRIPGSAAK